ncbi:MAG: sulfotransferase [Pseudomonadota bacterium]
MPTFLYGIGAARAGTTWLAQALRAHPQAALPAVKELHYFDALENGTTMLAMDQLVRQRTKVRDELAEADKIGPQRLLRSRVAEVDRWMGLVGSQVQDDARYASLLSARGGEATRLVADITPAYATLPEATFARMAALNDGDTKFLMLLRDPVDRLWSNIRLTLARRAARGVDSDAARSRVMNELAEGANLPELARADYAGTLTRLERAVPASQVKVMFYEDLVAGQGADDLTAFLGLDGLLKGDAEPVNAAGSLAMTDDERRLLHRAVAAQYDFARERFGALPAAWTRTLEEANA